ncbi:hypothetical protein KIW84_040085 [Lathyrus oleraceus]|uniref:Uncharacterized protein n=1 Tax=Pisum sativum TaxID=3888 RepID=A0A9D4X913_PEA|nr:hypothetical protein KIW84_040085 [Pisum sativum]
MVQEMLNALCRHGVEWVILDGLALRLRTSKFCQIPRAWASFFAQTLEVASNQSQFIVKWCLGPLALLRGGPINVGRVKVPTCPDDKMIGPKELINTSEIRRLPYNHQARTAQ